MKYYTKTRASARGGALFSADLPLFEWGRNQTLLADPVVRRLLRMRRISPALASVYGELLGLGGRHA
jgi:hypothetical protein